MNNLPRSRRYRFTWNNYPKDWKEQLMKIDHKYICAGKEVAPSTGTKHIQGCIFFDSKVSVQALIDIVPGIHYDRMDFPAQAIEYCKKDGKYIESGVPPQPGKRTDIHDIRLAISNGASLHQLEDMASNYQCLKMAQMLLPNREKKRDWKPVVAWFWGETGTGKSREAFKILPNAYRKSRPGKWWDGYDAHENVIMDDFRDSWMPFTDLLDLLDRYETSGNKKAGLVNLLRSELSLLHTNTQKIAILMLKRISTNSLGELIKSESFMTWASDRTP